ncbi:hypothetical protein HDU67_007622 [Dinochytrium kinnereticum]|nr:hypothetical protein HDU67_007622 [Dinochytrium kinnereticum]
MSQKYDDSSKGHAASGQASKGLAELDACLQLLRPKASDENKFVALFLLPRLLPDPNDHAKIQYAFDRMNFTFLKRLLRTQTAKKADDSSVPVITLHNIAVNILSGFCRIESLRERKELIGTVPALGKVLEVHARDPEYADIVGEILSFTAAIAAHPLGLQTIVDEDVLMHVAEILYLMNADELRGHALRTMNMIFGNVYSFDIVPKATFFQNVNNKVLPALSFLIKMDQTELKFQSVETLTLSMSVLNKLGMAVAEESWTADTRDGLYDILKNKIGERERDSALVLASSMVYAIGPRWLELSTLNRKGKKPESSGPQFSMLLVHIACAEVRVRLDEFTKDAVDSSSEVITASFRVIVAFMEALIESDNDDCELTLSPESLLSLRRATAETFITFMAALIERFEVYQESRDEQILESPIVTEGIHALGLWLAEETDIPQPEVKAAIPALLAVFRKDMSAAIRMSQAFVNLTAEPEIRGVFLDYEGLDVLIAIAARDEIVLEDTTGLSFLESILNCLQSDAAKIVSGSVAPLVVYDDIHYTQSLVDVSFRLLLSLQSVPIMDSDWSEVKDLLKHCLQGSLFNTICG